MIRHAHAWPPDVASCTHVDGVRAQTHCVVQSVIAVHGGKRNLGKGSRLDRKESGHNEDGKDICSHFRGSKREQTCPYDYLGRKSSWQILT